MNQRPDNQNTKSTFVNVLAWIFIVLAGFTTFISTLQNIMYQLVFPKEEISQFMQHTESTDQIPLFATLIFNNFDIFLMIILFLSVLTLISAIGLLKRMNWARIIFILIMSAGIVWNTSGLVVQFTMFGSMPEIAGADTPPPGFENMMAIMKIASVVMFLAMSALFGFVIMKLNSGKIKQEFA